MEILKKMKRAAFTSAWISRTQPLNGNLSENLLLKEEIWLNRATLLPTTALPNYHSTFHLDLYY